ncbi:hypothetical protein EWH99_13140 [Sporolactobacillus sp. THM7-7]|nr:hypothetical protein EWH99_13140 [Sporolactobacillus sp. THM7-7]
MNALLEAISNQVLKAQASEKVKAERYERSGARTDYRNGSYPHRLKTHSPPVLCDLFPITRSGFSTLFLLLAI